MSAKSLATYMKKYKIPKRSQSEAITLWHQKMTKDQYKKWRSRTGRNGSSSYTEEQILKELKRVKEQLGCNPTIKEFRKLGNMSSETVRKRFGKWNKALSKI